MLNLGHIYPIAIEVFILEQNKRLVAREFNLFLKEKNMRVFPFLFFLLFGLNVTFSQVVVNGTFNSTSSGWSCGPEATYFETTYGGSNPSNRVAEVDAGAGLCQTISGFSIGAVYSLDFICSRRTTCGPAVQSMNVSVDGGALAATAVSRTGGFGFTAESFEFVATSTTHTIDFTATIAGTCGLIVDDISINPVSLLPISLTDFSLSLSEDCAVDLYWTTKSERNNDYFVVEYSSNGADWQAIGYEDGAGNSSTTLHYSFTDPHPKMGISYYRLKQVDTDGNSAYSHVISTVTNCDNTKLFPNPTEGFVFAAGNKEVSDFRCYTVSGIDLTNRTKIACNKDSQQIEIDLSKLPGGTYILLIDNKKYKVIKI